MMFRVMQLIEQTFGKHGGEAGQISSTQNSNAGQSGIIGLEEKKLRV